ncbi:MAG: hypothetical protein AB1720_04245 [Pseudomonadota bacterium]
MADILAAACYTRPMLFIVPHLFPSPRLLETAAHDLRLPALETLLVRGSLQDAPAEGLEAALCEALGIARQQDWPIAPLTLAAEGEAPGEAWWLRADPVHLRVMRDRIVLAGSEALALSREEADALAAAIGRHFGAELAPRPYHPQRWYLRYADAPDLITTPLAVAIGRDIDPLLPQGADAMTFRSRLNELQMLLHDHPVNAAREARGEPAVNSLWLWGGGRAPAPGRNPPSVHARHAATLALAASCGARIHTLPGQLGAQRLGTQDVVVLDTLTESGQVGDAWGWREAMRALERDWFAPLRSQLRKTGPQGVRLLDPDHGKALHLTAGDAWRVWRRPRSLLERLTKP